MNFGTTQNNITETPYESTEKLIKCDDEIEHTQSETDCEDQGVKSDFMAIEDNVYCRVARKALKMDDYLLYSCTCVPDSRCLVNCENKQVNFECCPSTCPCKDNCSNTVIQRNACIPTQIFRTNGKGLGLKTITATKKGAFIGKYVGEVITRVGRFRL